MSYSSTLSEYLINCALSVYALLLQLSSSYFEQFSHVFT